ERAVLANAPSFLVEATRLGGDAKVFERLVGVYLVRLVEAGEVLTDDLVRSISLDAFGAPVPRRHATLRIEQVHGVLLHAFDEEPVLFAGRYRALRARRPILRPRIRVGRA